MNEQSKRDTIARMFRSIAETRRTTRKLTAEREAATSEARALLAEIDAPFARELAELAAKEAELVAAAERAITEFEEWRRGQLIAGIEVEKLSTPAGVTVQWRDRITVNIDELPPSLRKPAEADMAKVRAALKSDAEIPGVTVTRYPSIRVGGEP